MTKVYLYSDDAIIRYFERLNISFITFKIDALEC